MKSVWKALVLMGLRYLRTRVRMSGEQSRLWADFMALLEEVL